MGSLRSTPPTLPLRNFETNARRVRALICEVHPEVPARSRNLQSDVAAAAIVMTISAVDTYFGDRLAEDFGRRFGLLGEEALGDILASIFQSGAGDFEGRKFARALQHQEPQGEVVRMFRTHVDLITYQAPGVIAQEVGRFGVRNLWGDVDYVWRGKYGRSVKTESEFREWTTRRNAIAHRAGRSRGETSKRQAAEHVSSDEARDCLNFFSRLLGLIDYRLNDELYDGRQPRRRQSEVAVFDLEPVAARRKFVPARRRKPRAGRQRGKAHGEGAWAGYQPRFPPLLCQ